MLFTLAAYIAITSVASLLGYSEPKPTLLGIAILVAAAAVMPWLAKEKRQLSGATGSAALRADAAQSALCAYLSLIALAGLAIRAIWPLKWADPLAALAIIPLVVWEGREAIRERHLAVLRFASTPILGCDRLSRLVEFTPRVPICLSVSSYLAGATILEEAVAPRF